ncbi:MAG: TIGR04141 family sporadically distributed protein [Polyangiaceae bacterium]
MFLAKPGETEATLLEEAPPSRTAISSEGRHVGLLYTRPSTYGVPSWAAFFENAIDPNKLGLRSASASAVLVVPVKKRLFALTFGYGRSFINRGAVEESFGLRVTLNTVGENQIRSIDRKTFEGITTHVREQASKEGTFGDFGLNVERDLLRAVVGTPSDPEFGSRLAGMDALSVAARVKLAGLVDLLARYLTASQDSTYRRKHPWIGNIVEVRDVGVVNQLNETLFEDLRASNLERKWLAVPDLMEWTDVGGFRYTTSKTKPLLEDIHLSTYLAQVRGLQNLDLPTAKRHRVHAFSATSGEESDHWSVFNCLYAEVELSGETYLLNNGQWFHIDSRFARSVDSAISAIPSTRCPLIEYSTPDDEAKYNRRLAKSLQGSCLMDRKNITYGGGKSRIEFCDVLTSSRQMLHVKRYRGSAVLSHLFAQGAVSAAAFVADAEFRKRLNPMLCKGHRLKNPMRRPDAHHWEVAYVIASQSGRELRLPFFSRVTLRNAANQLASLGFQVTLTKVSIS